MESLRFFIKENKSILLLYGICFLLGIVLLVYSIFNILQGDVDAPIIRFILHSILFVPALLIYLKDFKKLVLVYKDCKEQKIETKNLYLRNQDFKNCKDEFNGAYKILYCSENKDDEYITEYWLYKSDLFYDDYIIGKQYKLTYYPNSKCLYSVESVSNNAQVKKCKKHTTNKKHIKNSIHEMIEINDMDAKKNKFFVIASYIIGLCTLPFFVYALIQLWQIKNIIDNFYLIFCIIFVSVIILYILLVYKFINSILLYCTPPKIVVDKFITIGIPVVNTSLKSNKAKFCLKVQNQKKRKKDLFFYSTDILGLGDLNERPGYLGYGDFIGMEYEIEYHKISHVIKSMKPIEKNNNQGTVLCLTQKPNNF